MLTASIFLDQVAGGQVVRNGADDDGVEEDEDGNEEDEEEDEDENEGRHGRLHFTDDEERR